MATRRFVSPMQTLNYSFCSCLLPPCTKAEVMRSLRSLRFVCLSFCHCLSFCVQDHCKSNRPISLKLGAMFGRPSQTDKLTYWWWCFSGYSFLIIFPLPSRNGIWRFISISYTVTGRNDWRRQRQDNESITFRKRSSWHPDLNLD